MKKALIIVDLQNDFLPGGVLPVKGGDRILPIINSLLNRAFDLKVASKDWHPVDHYSFATTHKKKPGDFVEDQILWPTHCVQGSFGAAFAKGWQSEKIEKIFYKGTDKAIDSYSTFFDNKQLHATGLHHYLKDQGTEEVYLAGLATDYCVLYSALDAVDLGYKTNVITDACKAVNLNPQDEEKALERMQKAGVYLILSKNLSF